MRAQHRLHLPVPRSLQRRLLLVTWVTAGLTLLASWFILSALFRDHARQQFIERLTADLDQVMARLDVDARGRPVLDASMLSDPRWQRPRSGRYWQIDAGGAATAAAALLRSRSLWDEQLAAPADLPQDGELHVHTVPGPGGVPLLLIERTLRAAGAATPWRVMVASEVGALDLAGQRFATALAASLGALLLLLVLASLVQVYVGLAPLRRLRQALGDLRDARAPRLEGRFPDEVQPVVDDLNTVLARNADIVARARAQAGNLAHALKTPLTVMAQAAEAAAAAPDRLDALPALVAEQVGSARRHVEWHLARSRAAAAQGQPGARAPIAPVVDGLLRVMRKLHADRALTMHADVPAPLRFAGEAEDLQEMLGNLLDNACRAALTQLRVTATRDGASLRLSIEDDGAGIAESLRMQALRRGARLDESTPGSGLGLAIVDDLAGLYGGSVTLGRSELGGLQVVLVLPAA